MTDKYTAYLTMLAQRDQIMLILASLALGVTLSWYALRFHPWYSRLRKPLLIGGMALYILTVITIGVSINA